MTLVRFKEDVYNAVQLIYSRLINWIKEIGVFTEDFNNKLKVGNLIHAFTHYVMHGFLYKPYCDFNSNYTNMNQRLAKLFHEIFQHVERTDCRLGVSHNQRCGIIKLCAENTRTISESLSSACRLMVALALPDLCGGSGTVAA